MTLIAGGGAGCDVFDVCTSNAECTRHFTELDRANGGGETVPGICMDSGICTRLLTDECTGVVGDYTDDAAILIGSLFGTQGAGGQSAMIGAQRQESVALAVEDFNRVGGIPGSEAGAYRPLVLVSCDDSSDLISAGSHLVDDLHIPAIIGPTTSQSTINLTQEVTAPGETVVISPTAGAASVAELDDGGFTFQMTPNDAQRGPPLIGHIDALENLLRAQRGGRDIRLAILYSDDAIGLGVRASLDSPDLRLNGAGLADARNLDNVRIDPVMPGTMDLGALVDDYAAFQPDIVLLAGATEVLKMVIPLEERWPTVDPAPPRPFYIGVESTKGADLTTPTVGNDDLRLRISGIGLTSGGPSASVLSAFQIAYQSRYGRPANQTGMGSSYDATYAIAFALAATADQPVSGRSIANGLALLSGGPTQIELGPTRILAAFQRFALGDTIDAVGAYTPLRWDLAGAILGGTIEVWCIGTDESGPVFEGSGLTYDLASGEFTGQYRPCDLPGQ